MPINGRCQVPAAICWARTAQRCSFLPGVSRARARILSPELLLLDDPAGRSGPRLPGPDVPFLLIRRLRSERIGILVASTSYRSVRSWAMNTGISEKRGRANIQSCVHSYTTTLPGRCRVCSRHGPDHQPSRIPNVPPPATRAHQRGNYPHGPALAGHHRCCPCRWSLATHGG